MIGSTPALLETWIESFNQEQTEAYEFDGHCAVLAGPGSGKTRVLAAKIARLLNHRAHGPRGVACVTYNNETVRAVRNRLGELGLNPTKRLFVGTVHKFCLACIVAPFGHLFKEELKPGMTVASLQQRDSAFRKALNDQGLEGKISNAWAQCEIYRRTHPLRDVRQWLENPELARLAESYESILQNRSLLDFDGMVIHALDLIRHHEFVRLALEARFPFLVVDEYQDLGYPLHLIVEFLMRDTEIEVFAAGDPDQSIYGFTGANSKYLRRFAQNSRVQKVDFKINYRSAQRIIDCSQEVLSHAVTRNYRSARNDKPGELFFVRCDEGLGHQAELIASRLIPYLRKIGITDDQIAILYIDKWDAVVLARALTEAEIKYAGERDQRYPRTHFTRWLEDVAGWCSQFPETQYGPNLEDLLFYYSEMNGEAGISHNPRDLPTHIRFFDAVSSVAMPNMPLPAWLEQLNNRLRLDFLLNARKDNPEDLEGWNSLRERCLERKTLAQFKLEDFARCGTRPDTVTLTTLHSSKGLEYDVVIMPGLEEGRIPRSWANSGENLAEARRVFYVGMTRARDSIYMLYSGWYKDGNGYTKRNGPSLFVKELQAKFPSVPLWIG